MAALDDLISQIPDESLRERIRAEMKRANRQKKFGLVFEEHLPEATPLYDIPVKRGSVVAKKDGQVTDIYYIERIEDGQATCFHKASEEHVVLPVDALVCVAQFGEPIYPYLQPLDTVCNAPDSDLWLTLIEADNYHALQLLEYLYAGKVDCIYIDPPYNTGARDWKYNNDYVDGNDTYRHSKWLSMMEKRLRIARRLLAPDGAMITTIDDNEYSHLQILINEIFPDALNQVISIQMNPGGTQGKAFSVTNEYAIITYFKETAVFKKQHSGGDTYNLRRWGSTSNRYEGATCFYPIILDAENNVIGFGDVLPDELHPSAQVEVQDDGTKLVWPLDVHDTEKKWRYARATVEDVKSRMFIVENGSRIEVMLRRETEPPKTMWMSTEYNAEAYGTKLIKDILGKGRFSYPKSVYATKDCLAMFVAGKPDALILDFFAGSGTTLHAVNLLNAEDSGHRRCIIVTNNEVSDDEAKKLRAKGIHPGDVEWESLGVAQYVTWPRTVCSIMGCDVKGKPLTGDYGVEVEDYVIDEESAIVSKTTGKPLKTTVYKKTVKQLYPSLAQMKKADGFKANAAFFKLGFLDKNAVALGRQFKELLPVLWLKAGAYGPCPSLEGEKDVPAMLVLQQNHFAVLTDEAQYEAFAEQVNSEDAITTVYIVTDSEPGYRDMISGLHAENTYQLYRDYLDNFRINHGGR